MFLALPGVFPADLARNAEFVRTLGDAYDLIASHGSLAAVAYALVVGIWTLAHVANAWASSLLDFMVARFAIGLGESGNFPAVLKAVRAL
jgi:hypothetical protein